MSQTSTAHARSTSMRDREEMQMSEMPRSGSVSLSSTQSKTKDADLVFDADSEHSSGSLSNHLLPSPVTSPGVTQNGHANVGSGKPNYKFGTAIIIPIWIVLSSCVILYNNHLYNNMDFKFPVFIVTWHLLFATMGTRVLQRTTHLLDAAKEMHITKQTFLRSILPIGVLFSASLVLSNTAYLYLSVHYIQMLKAFNPVAILIISYCFQIKDITKRLFLIVCMISCGVALASKGELRFDLAGFLIQAAAVAFEASRLVMIEILLHGLKMDPLVSLHYYAPVCFVINALVLPFTEGLEPFYQLARIGPAILISNAAFAFLLNVAAVFLVGAGSGLVLTLAGVFKDILLVSGSVLFFSAEITPLQVLGYSIALGGLVLYKTAGSK